MLTADIDIGGTLTDGIFIDGERLVCVKVDTTPHDLTVCLFDCLTQGASQLDYPDIDDFLEKLELIRWSTTITSNVLAEFRGPRLGLLVSRGHEKDLYGDAARSMVLDRIVFERDVIGIDENSSDTDIMNGVRSLLESGVRRICVSLKGAQRHPESEIRIKRVIDQQYPDHFLGSVPVLAGSDISKSADDATRTYCAIINAYTHGALAATLFKAEDDLREGHRYAGTFLVSHINGGVAGIAKTKAIDTIESGPILGIHGSAHLAKAYGVSNVIALDVGGTTAKVSVLRGSASVQRNPSDFFGIPVKISLPYLRSIALGGGSVVKVSPNEKPGEIALGPESMGSLPGPACYNLGGDKPTLTDAFVAAGLINPEYFLGGTKSIDLNVARGVVEELVAQPLHVSLDEACRKIIGAAFEAVANLITNSGAELGEGVGSHSLFAYGGNGGLFACGVAERAGLQQVYFFDLGPVFSAFGSSVSDISHVYERTIPMAAVSEKDLSMLNRILEEIKADGRRDLLGEGIKPDGIEYSIELDIPRPRQSAITVEYPESCFRDFKTLRELWERKAGTIGDGVAIELIRVKIRKAMPKPALAKKPAQGSDSAHALKGTRKVAWGSSNGEAKLYRWESLQPGNCVTGCAVLEGANSTYFVPEGWSLLVDEYGNAKLNRS
ncbi:MAG TPA: hydantoinase/oxoprolinase family protein [Methylomirabilota bacterium]|nr:hydantoinase/oxoprolinase family protein [Methylomirabilota bacterium]